MSTEDKRQFWKSHITRQEQSADRQKEYCAKEGLSLHTFKYWKTKLNKEGQAIGGETSCFIPIRVVDGERQESQPGLPDPQWLAKFLLALRQGARP